MADDRRPPLDDEDDWASEWDDADDAAGVDASAPGQAPQATPSTTPARPAATEPAPAPDYNEDPYGNDDDVLLPPNPAEVIHERSQQRQPSRQPRVRAAGVPAPAFAEPQLEPDLDDEPANDPKPPSNRNGRGCILSLVLSIVIVAVAVGMIIFATGGSFGSLLGGSDEDAAPPSETSIPLSSDAPTASADEPETVAQVIQEECVPSGDDKVTVDNGRGDQKTGEGAILAFDYAYYVERSGSQARALMSDSIKETTADTLQAAIDKLPKGAGHCLTITPERPNVYTVKLAEYVPDGDEVSKSVYDQEITVDKVDDKFVIVGVVNG